MWLLENLKFHTCFYGTAMPEETHSSMGVIIIKEKMRTWSSLSPSTTHMTLSKLSTYLASISSPASEHDNVG